MDSEKIKALQAALAKAQEKEFVKTIKVRLTLMEEALGTSPSDEEIYDNFIASNAPDAMSRTEEIEAHGLADVAEKSRTCFPRMEDGTPFIWDYQIRGMFKDNAGMICKTTIKETVQEYNEDGTPKGKPKRKNTAKSETGKVMTEYSKGKIIDGLIFVTPRKIPLKFKGGIGDCQRPLRAQTMQGERVALASSDTVPAGTELEFTVGLKDTKYEAAVREWLDYGCLRGLGQWRNSGKGIFLWEELDDNGNTIGGNYKS